MSFTGCPFSSSAVRIWSRINIFPLLLFCHCVLNVLFAGVNWISSQPWGILTTKCLHLLSTVWFPFKWYHLSSVPQISWQQLPSDFLLLLDVHTAQWWDVTSSLLSRAVLCLNMSPLALLSHALLTHGVGLTGLMKLQVWLHMVRVWDTCSLCGISVCILMPSEILVFLGGTKSLQSKPLELSSLCQSYYECKVVIIYCGLCLALHRGCTSPWSS